MFTGIIEDVGTVRVIEKSGKEVVLGISVRKIDSGEIMPGESIAVNGVCLTVVSVDELGFSVEVSQETLSRTGLLDLSAGSGVNLERSLRMGDRMGGHVVNGHVDGVGMVESISSVGESLVFWFSIPESLSRYVVEKGSIAVDGVSLTVNSVRDDRFSVNIIPYTQKETVFSELVPGSRVNLECDIIGKYVEKMLAGRNNT